MNKQKLSSNNGFTLVEMAIVLVIVGLLVGLGSGMITPLTNMAKLRETREIIDSDVTSIVGWSASNNRVPNGYTELQTIISKPNDAWGGAVYYFSDTLLPAIPGNICGRKTTNLTICQTAICAAANRITNVAYALISAGGNRNPQTGIIACPVGISGTCLSVYDNAPSNDNCTGVANCPPANVAPAFNRITKQEEYDDVVRWVTLDELRGKIGCQGAQLKILNNELPVATVATPYNATLIPDGGVPFTTSPNTYRWCVQSTAPPGMNFTPATFNANCAGLTEGSWSAATPPLTISGMPSTSGTYSFTVFIRDNNDTAAANDNTTSKTFVLTVNP